MTRLIKVRKRKKEKRREKKKKKNDDLPRRYLHMIVTVVLYWYRDLAMLKCGVRDGLEHREERDRLESFLVMDRATGEWSVVQDLEELASKVDSNLNTRLFLDNLFMTATRIGEEKR